MHVSVGLKLLIELAAEVGYLKGSRDCASETLIEPHLPAQLPQPPVALAWYQIGLQQTWLSCCRVLTCTCFLCIVQRGGNGRSGQRPTAYGQTINLSPQSSSDWQHHSSNGALCSERSSSSSNRPLQQPQHSSQLLPQQQYSNPAATAVTAAFGDCRPAGVYQAAADEDHSGFAGESSAEYYDMHSRVSSAGPGQELSFAATSSPAGTDGGSYSSAGGASYSTPENGGKLPAAAGQSNMGDGGFRIQPAAAVGDNSSKELFGGQVPSSSQSKKGRMFKCCFMQTASATASPAGSGAGAAPVPQGSANPGVSRMGCRAGNLQEDPAGGNFGGMSAQGPCAGMVHAQDAGHSDSGRRDSCMADDHSFCSAESVAATSWTGSCAGTERDMSISCNGSTFDGQHFPLQPMPPPPLWASPLFPPPQGYMPVGVDEMQHSHHAHFTQRVKMLRLQAAAVAAGGQIGGNNAEGTGQEGQHSMLQDSAGQELSMPLRQKHMHQRASAQQEMGELQEEPCSAGMEEALPVQGLTVKVKGSGWSSDSPTRPQSDRIKAFFEVRSSAIIASSSC